MTRAKGARPAAAGEYLHVALRHVDLARAGRRVLRDVRWDIRPGERWVLAGGNGAGKTQLLKLVAGAVWPTPTGHEVRRYEWRGERFDSPYGVLEEIAYVGPERQDKYDRYEWDHTVAAVVGTGIHRTEIPRDPLDAAQRREIASLLRRLSIGAFARRRFLTLSYGERRLVLLARALASRPRLLLLDELFNGLDGDNRARALKWLEGTRRSHLPWVLATHRREDVPRNATHALLLDAGRVVYRGPIARAPLGRWLPAAAGSGRNARRASRASGEPIVTLTDADVFLDGKRILHGLGFAVHAGDCWVVHGANGAGKSTLVRALYGDHPVASWGTIRRRGIVPGIPLDTFQRRVGLIAPHLQSDHPPYQDVETTVVSGLHASVGLNEAPAAGEKRRARTALAEFGLEGFARRTLRELSYGQLRRVLFARAWIGRPLMLLLDEPFSGVDAPTRRVLLAAIERLVAGGTAVVLATHHRDEWPTNATHELQLSRGRACYVGPARTSAR